MLRSLRLMFLAFLSTLRARTSGRPRYPGWSFSFEMVIRYLRLDWEETASWDLVRLREDMESRPYPKDFARKVAQDDVLIGGISARRFRPPGSVEGDRVILFLHGGSYIFGSGRSTHAEVMARLAFQTGIEVLGPDFRSSPEHRYPAQLEDVLAVYLGLLGAGTPPEKIALVGDSSGGNLALSLALALRDQGVPLPRALGLISPWCDLEMRGASFVENDRYDFGTREVLVNHARAFSGELALSDPRVSPIHAELSGLCPCLVIVGELEIPRDDILALHRKLEEAGVESELHLARQMPHNPPAFAALHPEGARSIQTLAEFLAERVGSPKSPRIA